MHTPPLCLAQGGVSFWAMTTECLVGGLFETSMVGLATTPRNEPLTTQGFSSKSGETMRSGRSTPIDLRFDVRSETLFETLGTVLRFRFVSCLDPGVTSFTGRPTSGVHVHTQLGISPGSGASETSRAGYLGERLHLEMASKERGHAVDRSRMGPLSFFGDARFEGGDPSGSHHETTTRCPRRSRVPYLSCNLRERFLSIAPRDPDSRNFHASRSAHHHRNHVLLDRIGV